MYKQLSAILIASILVFTTTQAFASSDDNDDKEELKGPFNGKVVLNKLTDEYVRVITPANAYLTFHSDE